jgi:hypothetical protein
VLGMAALLASGTPGCTSKQTPRAEASPAEGAHDGLEESGPVTPATPETPGAAPGKPAEDACHAAIRAFLAGRFADAPALPAGCSVDAVADLLVSAGGNPANPGNAGTSRRSLRWRLVTAAGGGPARIRLWHDGSAIVMLEQEDPEIPGGWPALATSLGAPDAKLDFYKDVVAVPGGQWVYGGRGLAFFSSLADQKLDRVVMFAPTGVDQYRDGLALALGRPREI